MAHDRRQNLVLAALSPAESSSYSPVQVQKLEFLIDRNVSGLTGGPYFNFVPYDYGPFDSEVYAILDALAAQDLVEKSQAVGRSWSTYRLTPEGLRVGRETLGTFDAKAQSYIQEVSQFVRQLSFAALVSAIYKAYPEMKANSVFGK